MLIIVMLTPVRLRLHYVLLVILAVVTIMGGFGSMRAGDRPSISDGTILWYWHFGYPLFVGACIPLVIYLSYVHFTQQDPESSAI